MNLLALLFTTLTFGILVCPPSNITPPGEESHRKGRLQKLQNPRLDARAVVEKERPGTATLASPSNSPKNGTEHQAEENNKTSERNLGGSSNHLFNHLISFNPSLWVFQTIGPTPSLAFAFWGFTDR